MNPIGEMIATWNLDFQLQKKKEILTFCFAIWLKCFAHLAHVNHQNAFITLQIMSLIMVILAAWVRYIDTLVQLMLC